MAGAQTYCAAWFGAGGNVSCVPNEMQRRIAEGGHCDADRFGGRCEAPGVGTEAERGSPGTKPLPRIDLLCTRVKAAAAAVRCAYWEP